MAKIVNLRTVRKQRARDAARREGDARSLQSGRSKVERKLTTARNDKARAELDGHKREE